MIRCYGHGNSGTTKSTEKSQCACQFSWGSGHKPLIPLPLPLPPSSLAAYFPANVLLEATLLAEQLGNGKAVVRPLFQNNSQTLTVEVWHHGEAVRRVSQAG